VDVGKLNVTGDQITVEAVFNRTQPYVPGGGDNTEGDLVSKHDNPNDVNYLLRPNEGSITTNKGFFTTPIVSTAQLNKTYHVAMVYDGDTLKFYRDGCLISKVAASGNLYQNNWDTRIAYYQNQIWNTNFIGYITEVRIWNVARTQSEIQAYMNRSLPNPTTQTGLLAYYTFDNLINKQGNAAWNGTIGGSASINQTNPNCNPIINSCKVDCNPGFTITKDTSICIGSSIALFATGGGSYSWSPSNTLNNPSSATPTATPTSTTTYNVTVDDKKGCIQTGSVEIKVNDKPSITISNDTSICENSAVQLEASGGTKYSWNPSTGLSNDKISNPVATPSSSTKYFVTVTNSSGCSNTGSVQVKVNKLPSVSITKDTSICKNTSVQLFASGGNTYSWKPSSGLNKYDVANPVASPDSSTKYYVIAKSTAGCTREDSVSITVNNLPSVSITNDTSICKTSSLQLNASGGNTYNWTPSTGLSKNDIANPVASPSSSTKYFVSVTNSAGCSKEDSVQVTIKDLPSVSISNDTSICRNSSVPLSATGGNAYSWTPSIGLNNTNTSNPIATPAATTKYFVNVRNAAGCSNRDSVQITVYNFLPIGLSGDTSICKNSTVQLHASGGSIYSWSPSSGLNSSNISNPVANPPTTTKYFVTVKNSTGCGNKDSVLITVNDLPSISKSNDTAICTNSSVQLFASGGGTYSWTPATLLNNANISNPVATPAATTDYNVTITNQYGCLDSAKVLVTVNPRPAISVSNDTTICQNSPVTLFASGGNSYQWIPASSVDNASSPSPSATPATTTVFHVSITDSYACVYDDSVKISVIQPPAFSVSQDKSMCKSESVQLNASGGNIYEWWPETNLNDPNINDPLAAPDSTTTYSVIIKDSTCNFSDTLSTNVIVHNTPVITATHDNDITCSFASSQLNASGGKNYSWTPASGLDNFGISDPVASPTETTVYTVTGTDQYGCSSKDTVTVKVNFVGKGLYVLPNSFTPNNDGLNDCFGIQRWGQVTDLDFSIYNRFGQKIFHTNNPNICWDGTYNGNPQQPDIFVYIIKAKAACGNIDKKGIVALLR
jgi:gliding motility-associated-like protein